MVTRYAIDTPDQLRELSQFVKEGRIEPYYKVWNADRNAHEGRSVMNGQFIVELTTKGMKAAIIRASEENEKELALLKYTHCKRYCETNKLTVTLHTST